MPRSGPRSPPPRSRRHAGTCGSRRERWNGYGRSSRPSSCRARCSPSSTRARARSPRPTRKIRPSRSRSRALRRSLSRSSDAGAFSASKAQASSSGSSTTRRRSSSWERPRAATHGSSRSVRHCAIPCARPVQAAAIRSSRLRTPHTARSSITICRLQPPTCISKCSMPPGRPSGGSEGRALRVLRESTASLGTFAPKRRKE